MLKQQDCEHIITACEMSYPGEESLLGNGMKHHLVLLHRLRIEDALGSAMFELHRDFRGSPIRQGWEGVVLMHVHT